MTDGLQKQKGKVLIITGIAPIDLAQLEEWGFAPGPLLAAFMSGRTRFSISIPTLGPVAVGSYLQRHGIEVEIEDFYCDEVCASDADIVGISSTFMGVENVREAVDVVREQNPSAPIVLGGPLSWSVSPSELLRMVPNIDYIVQREGEQTFLELIRMLWSGGDPDSVRGVVFRKDGSVVETMPRPALNELDLSQPVWELMGMPSPKRLPVLPVETSRGCPYHCAYCAFVSYWGKPVRYRRSDSVVEELRHNAESFGITTFRFGDSCFSAPPRRCAEICDALYQQCIKEGIEIKWTCYARIDNLDYSLLEKMKRAGCVAMDIGLESGAVSILRRMGKHYSPESAVEVARMAREIGIIINFNILIGFPGETKETLQATAELVDRAAPDTFACWRLSLMPNTLLSNKPKKYGIEGSFLTWKHETMTSEDAAEAQLWFPQQVSRSISFPGGEYVACYLTSIGFSQEEVRGFYRASANVARGSTDDGAVSVVSGGLQKLDEFFVR